MQVLVEEIVSSPDFTTPVEAFVRRRMLSAVDKDLNQDTQLIEKIHSLPDRSPSALSGRSDK